MIPDVGANAPEPTVDPAADGLAARLRGAEEQLAAARDRLLEAEQANAELGVLREALRTATSDLAEQEARHAGEVAELERALELSRAQTAHLERLRTDLQGSLSWRITRPLRAAKRASGGGSGPA